MAAVENITYADGVAAWLVRPNDEAATADPYAGVVLWHWFSQEPLGDRNEFLDEARELAGRGVVCLLPQGRFPWFEDPTGADHDLAAIEGEVARFSAGLDLLAARPDVDQDRLAVVGHDFGAMLASIVAAREQRVRAAVLIAPTPRWGDWFLPFWAIEEGRGAYLSALEPLDPQAQMASIAPAAGVAPAGRTRLLRAADGRLRAPPGVGRIARARCSPVRRRPRDGRRRRPPRSGVVPRGGPRALIQLLGTYPLESAHARSDRTDHRGPADQR